MESFGEKSAKMGLTEFSRVPAYTPYFLLGEVEMSDGRGPALVGRLDSVESYT